MTPHVASSLRRIATIHQRAPLSLLAFRADGARCLPRTQALTVDRGRPWIRSHLERQARGICPMLASACGRRPWPGCGRGPSRHARSVVRRRPTQAPRAPGRLTIAPTVRRRASGHRRSNGRRSRPRLVGRWTNAASGPACTRAATPDGTAPTKPPADRRGALPAAPAPDGHADRRRPPVRRRRQRHSAGRGPPRLAPDRDPVLPPSSSWIVPAVPDVVDEPESSWSVPAVPTVPGTVVRPTGSRRRPQARTTGRRERGATAPPSTRPARTRAGSTHPTGRVPDDLVDALGHLDRERSAAPTVYIDDYAIDQYGVEQIGAAGQRGPAHRSPCTRGGTAPASRALAGSAAGRPGGGARRPSERALGRGCGRAAASPTSMRTRVPRVLVISAGSGARR